MFRLTKYLLIGICFTLPLSLIAHNAGRDSSSLDTAIKNANAGVGGDFTVNFTQDVTLLDFAKPSFDRGTPVRAVNANPSFQWLGNNISIFGNNRTLTSTEGRGSQFSASPQNARGLFVGGAGSSTTGLVTIDKLSFAGLFAKGGDGAGGGGGGLGAGGGLYVGANAKVKLVNCRFSNCQTRGGSGGIINSTFRFGGGGGLRGNGANGSDSVLRTVGGGGGGFGGNGANGRAVIGGNIGAAGGGSSGFTNGNANGESPGGNFDGVRTPAGGSGIGGEPGQTGGFGGGGGGTRLGQAPFSPGNGGTYGGGGGGTNVIVGNGNGGFGGGGGGGAINGGNGGFGAGGGGFIGNIFGSGTGGASVFGGERGVKNRGGNGAGLGGAIFLEPGADLTIEGSASFSLSGARALSGAVGRGNDIFMMSSSLLTFDISSDVFLSSPIEGDRGAGGGSIADGAGGLVKRGTATLTLFGNNTYTGGTRIQQGKLGVRGSSLLGNVDVSAGATLEGVPEIEGNLNNSGTVEPGGAGDDDEIGIIRVKGNYINDGIVRANIRPGFLIDNDAIKVDGQTTLGPASTLVLFPLPGNYIAGTEFLIIDGATTGVFGSVVKEGPLADLLDFDIRYTSVIVTVLNNRLFEDQDITAGPAKAVVECVLAAIPIVPHSDFAQMIEELGTLTDSQVNTALVNISPVAFGALEWINARNNSYIVNLLSQYQFELCCSPRDCCSCTCNANIWINGFGNFMNNHERLDFVSPYTANAGGVLAGVDYCFGPCYYIGASFGYIRTDLQWKRHLGHGDMNTFLGALYAIFKGSCLNVDISLIGGGTENDVKRHLDFGDVSRTAKSDFWTEFFTAHLGFHTNWESCCFNFEPFALLDYHFFHRNSFHEHGAESLNLHVKSKNQSIMRVEAGLKGYYSIMCECSCFAPYLGLSYVGEFPLGRSHQKASFINQTCVIDAISYDSCVNLGSPEAGLKWTHVNGFSFVVGYKGLYNTKTSINEVEGRLEWVF